MSTLRLLSWSEQTYEVGSPTVFKRVSAALGENTLYFLTNRKSIFKYELATRNRSTIQPPQDFTICHGVLMQMEDDGFGVARLANSMLHLWSMEIGSAGDARWRNIGVI